MTGTETHKSILRRVVAALAVSGMVVSLAGRASGTTFEKAINPNYSYTEDVFSSTIVAISRSVFVVNSLRGNARFSETHMELTSADD